MKIICRSCSASIDVKHKPKGKDRKKGFSFMKYVDSGHFKHICKPKEKTNENS